MRPYNGQLNINAVYQSLYSLLIRTQAFVNNLKHNNSKLMEEARVDASEYGDTIQYVSTDIIPLYDWLGDEEAQNLLKLHRAPLPKTQSLTLDVFKLVPLTTDNYRSKQAWGTPDAFAQFNSTIVSWMADVRKLYETTTYLTYIGCHKETTGKQDYTLTLPAEPVNADEMNIEAYNRSKAQAVGQAMADLMVELGDYSRDFNTFGAMRSYDPSELRIIFNSKWVNQIEKRDLPTLFHNDKIIEGMRDNVVPARYFGTILSSGGTAPSGNGEGAETAGTIRSLIAKDYNVVDPHDASWNPKLLVFPGDAIPAGQTYNANEAYEEDGDIAFKIIHKQSVPMLSGFQYSSDFFNSRANTNTMYLIFAHNTLEALAEYPFITATADYAE